MENEKNKKIQKAKCYYEHLLAVYIDYKGSK